MDLDACKPGDGCRATIGLIFVLIHSSFGYLLLREFYSE
jgi:hypothetical protein